MTIKLGSTAVNKVILGEEPSSGPTSLLTYPLTVTAFATAVKAFEGLIVGQQYEITYSGVTGGSIRAQDGVSGTSYHNIGGALNKYAFIATTTDLYFYCNDLSDGNITSASLVASSHTPVAITIPAGSTVQVSGTYTSGVWHSVSWETSISGNDLRFRDAASGGNHLAFVKGKSSGFQPPASGNVWIENNSASSVSLSLLILEQ